MLLVVGANLTITVQLAAAFRVVPQVPPFRVNGVVGAKVKVPVVSCWLPVFVTVSVRLAVLVEGYGSERQARRVDGDRVPGCDVALELDCAHVEQAGIGCDSAADFRRSPWTGAIVQPG